MKNKTETEKAVNLAIDKMLGHVVTRVEHLISVSIENERQFDDAKQILRSELYRNSDSRTNALVKNLNDGVTDVGEFVQDYLNRTQGLVLTVIETFTSIQATKDIACRFVWQDNEWFKNELLSATK